MPSPWAEKLDGTDSAFQLNQFMVQVEIDYCGSCCLKDIFLISVSAEDLARPGIT